MTNRCAIRATVYFGATANMMARWQSLPIRLRLFLSFGTVLALAMLLALYLQARTHSQARLDNLLHQELPAQVEGLAAHINLSLSQDLAISESLANSYFIERWVRDGLPQERQGEVTAYLTRLMTQLETELLLLPRSIRDKATIFSFAMVNFYSALSSPWQRR